MSASEDRLKDWIEKADHDLGTAIVINQYIPDYSDTLVFHCQQAGMGLTFFSVQRWITP